MFFHDRLLSVSIDIKEIICLLFFHSWDDWVLEDRLRKATEENRELAANLRREVEAAARQKNAKPAAKKRAMSDRSSVRDSEERGNSVLGRASKRARGETDIEKVRYRCSFSFGLHIKTSPPISTIFPSILPKHIFPNSSWLFSIVIEYTSSHHASQEGFSCPLFNFHP